MDNNVHIADIHCHILPGVDDGSKSMEQTLSMLQIAYDEGVRLMIATPHFHIGRMKVEGDEIYDAVERLESIIEERFPELEIYAGQEIYYYSEAMEALDSGDILTMADSQYILMEYSVDENYDIIKSSVHEAITSGYTPILAHIERYMCLVDKPERVEYLINSGAYMQVNASSVAGSHGKMEQKFIKKLLKKHMIHFVASDAHSDRSRAPRFADASKELIKICGTEYYMDLIWNNPVKVINNEQI